MSEFLTNPNWPDEPSQAWLLEQKIMNAARPAGYIQELRNSYEKSEVGLYLAKTARLIEPKDIVTGEDPEVPAAKTFYAGNMLGLEVAHELLGHGFDMEVLGRLPDVDIAGGDKAERLRDVEDRTFEIMEVAERGYAQAAAFHEVLESMEDDLSPDVMYQPYIKRGFGVVMYQVYEALYERDCQALELEADRVRESVTSGSDYLDEELRRLVE